MVKYYKNITLLIFLTVLFTLAGCDLTENDSITEPGRFRIWLSVNKPQNYSVQHGDSLEVSASDFRVFNGENYANVFQHPDQFLPSQDSVVSVNLLKNGLSDKYIQVAYGSLPPEDYDRFLFLLSPSPELILGAKTYPLRSSGDNTKTLIELQESVEIKENKTTNLYIRIDFEKTVYRLLDEFVFDINIEEVRFENE